MAARERTGWLSRDGGLTCVYLLSAAACCLLAVASRARLVDLHVYRVGGQAVRSALGYGQIDLLAAGVLYDIWLPDTAAMKGAAIGLAAGARAAPAIVGAVPA